jgi:hypothetical protein
MAEARQRRRRASSRGIKLVRNLARGRPRRTGRSARLPELPNVLAELLPSCSPICLYAVAELGHVALEIELVLLQPRHVEFSAGGSTLELAIDVLVVVADDPAWLLVVKDRGQLAMSYLVMMPVVLRPSVLWVTKNMPFSLMGP